jgi:hypothetical protein
MSEDSTATKNPVTCQANSITPKTLVIKDTSRGKKSVVEDLPGCDAPNRALAPGIGRLPEIDGY